MPARFDTLLARALLVLGLLDALPCWILAGLFEAVRRDFDAWVKLSFSIEGRTLPGLTLARAPTAFGSLLDCFYDFFAGLSVQVCTGSTPSVCLAGLLFRLALAATSSVAFPGVADLGLGDFAFDGDSFFGLPRGFAVLVESVTVGSGVVVS